MQNVDTKTGFLKNLLGIIPTNCWDSTGRDWKLEKSKWNEIIDMAGSMANVNNPRFATRENCWQPKGNLSSYLSKDGSDLNQGASVLDPYVCELVLRLFMPKGEGLSVYNPFAGGVQMGMVAGFLGHNYTGTEIRLNQCDANNALVHAYQMDQVQWEPVDSVDFQPEQDKYDLIFSCPPYYGVEDYRDYSGMKPNKELNNLPNYQSFKEALFAAFKKSFTALKENRFFVLMIGDSRDKSGAYYSFEAETELFMREMGLHIYNRIVFLEARFSRLIQAHSMIKSRKLPKVEQKILVGFKGNLKNIKINFDPINQN
jgi:hypothetical protein